MGFNLLRVGIVSSVDESLKAVRVVIEDQDDLVTGWLQVIVPPIAGISIQFPAVGDMVLCAFLGSGIETGYCLGKVGGV